MFHNIFLHNKFNKNRAFTLAETLITLGIIGVVATICIPVLIQNVEDMKYKNAAKEAYSKCSQAILQLKADSGGTLVDYLGAGSLSFKPAYMKYFKVVKDCGGAGCVAASSSSSIYKTLAGYGGDTLNLGNDGQFVTADGIFYNIQQDGVSGGSTPGTLGTVIIIVDINGYQTPPNIFGKDTFAFQILNNNLTPMGGTGTEYPATNYCQRTGSNIAQGIGCMTNVMQGIDY